MEGGRRALSAAYRLLARRGHSVREVEAALEKKGFSADEIGAAVRELSAKRYLDDRAFAADYAQALFRHKKAGPRYIKEALKKKGVAESLADAAVAEVYGDAEAEARMAARLAAKKGASLKKGLSPVQRKKRIFDYLLRRGFPYDAVMKALRGPADEE